MILLLSVHVCELVGRPATEASLRSDSIMLSQHVDHQVGHDAVLSRLSEVSVACLPIISQP
jgi:hypothetical protein